MKARRAIPTQEIQLEPGSVVDSSGRIFYWNDRVFREVLDVESWALYQRLLASQIMKDLVAEGLVETWIPDDVQLEGSIGLLEHKKIDFVSCRAEWTHRMLWDAARRYVECAAILSRDGLTFKDCHPWNVLFDFCRPTIVDLGSITQMSAGTGWTDELRRFFVLPLWLRKVGRGLGSVLAREMMYEHHHGVGGALSRTKYVSWFPLGFQRLSRRYERAVRTGDRRVLSSFFELTLQYIEGLEPQGPREAWASYEQGEENPTPGQKMKQDCVLNELSRINPATVLDMGANKGWYAFAAESLGYKVIAFDREDYCVDLMYRKGQEENRRILPLHMDFLLPTPQSGVALALPSSFERLRCDVSLVLGLVHHLAISQGIHFDTIAQIVDRYTRKATIVEFVTAEDEHIANWPIPLDYGKDNFIRAMSKQGFTVANDQQLIKGRSLVTFARNPKA